MPYGPRNKAIQTKRKTRLTIQELDQAVMRLDQAVIGQPVQSIMPCWNLTKMVATSWCVLWCQKHQSNKIDEEHVGFYYEGLSFAGGCNEKVVED